MYIETTVHDKLVLYINIFGHEVLSKITKSSCSKSAFFWAKFNKHLVLDMTRKKKPISYNDKEKMCELFFGEGMGSFWWSNFYEYIMLSNDPLASSSSYGSYRQYYSTSARGLTNRVFVYVCINSSISMYKSESIRPRGGRRGETKL